jgi:hypothetical protein
MDSKRLSLVNYDVAREQCSLCGEETFHFLPIGDRLQASTCWRCGELQTEVDVSETAIARLVTFGSHRLMITPEDRGQPN